LLIEVKTNKTDQNDQDCKIDVTSKKYKIIDKRKLLQVKNKTPKI